MKKMTSLLVGILTFTMCYSQDPSFRIGIKGGANLSGIAFGKDDSSFEWGFHLGVVSEHSLGRSIVLRPSLSFMRNGGNMSGIHYIFNQIQLPLDLTYKFSANLLNLFLQGGPYIGCMTSGSAKSEGISVDLFDKDLWRKIGEKRGIVDLHPYRRVDYGLGLSAGVELTDDITVHFGYQVGLRNINPNVGNKTRINTMRLSVGYFF